MGLRKRNVKAEELKKEVKEMEEGKDVSDYSSVSESGLAHKKKGSKAKGKVKSGASEVEAGSIDKEDGQQDSLDGNGEKGVASEDGNKKVETGENAGDLFALGEDSGNKEEHSKEDDIINKLQSELDSLQDKYTRALAEYDNYRKRTKREKESWYNSAKMDTIKAFLSTYDNLERACEASDSKLNLNDAHLKGIQMTFKQFKDTLKSLGVVEIEALGKEFNPEYHNAVNHIEDREFGANEVSKVYQSGFMLDGKVIRYAIVQVAN